MHDCLWEQSITKYRTILTLIIRSTIIYKWQCDFWGCTYVPVLIFSSDDEVYSSSFHCIRKRWDFVNNVAGTNDFRRMIFLANGAASSLTTLILSFQPVSARSLLKCGFGSGLLRHTNTKTEHAFQKKRKQKTFGGWWDYHSCMPIYFIFLKGGTTKDTSWNECEKRTRLQS